MRTWNRAWRIGAFLALAPVPTPALTYLPRRWQSRRMSPWKMDVGPFAEYLAAWHRFLRRTQHLRGAVVELGVRAGDRLILANLWARRRGDRRWFYGFDSFAAFPPAAPQDDSKNWDAAARQYARHLEEREHAHVPDGWIPDRFFHAYPYPCREWVEWRIGQYGASNVRLVEGWFAETLPAFHEPISLVFNDSAMYEATVTALGCLWDRLSPGGVWINGNPPGPRRALAEFLEGRNYTAHNAGRITYVVKV